jgi:hypothetical protein
MSGAISGAFSIFLEYKYHHRKSRYPIPESISSALNTTKENMINVANNNTNNNNNSDEKENNSMSMTVTEQISSLPLTSSFPPAATSSSASKAISHVWHSLQYRYGNRIIDNIFELLNNEQGSIGCSSAVYSLCAFDFALTLDHSTKIVRKLYQKWWLKHANVLISQRERIALAFDLLSIYSGLKRIQMDVQYLMIDNSSRHKKMDHWIVQSQDQIGHSSHVGGFVNGLLVYLLWRSYKKYKEKQRRNSRGHRLG